MLGLQAGVHVYNLATITNALVLGVTEASTEFILCHLPEIIRP